MRDPKTCSFHKIKHFPLSVFKAFSYFALYYYVFKQNVFHNNIIFTCLNKVKTYCNEFWAQGMKLLFIFFEKLSNKACLIICMLMTFRYK